MITREKKQDTDRLTIMPNYRTAIGSACVAVFLLLLGCEPRAPATAGLEAVYDSSRFRLQVSQQRLEVYDRNVQRTVFSAAAEDLISAHRADVQLTESHGYYSRVESPGHSCGQAKIERADPYSEYFLLSGSFQSPGCDLKFYLRVAVTDQAMFISAYTSDENYNQLSFGFDSVADETVMGFGSQVSQLNFKQLEVPIWVQRQGIGRGAQPLSTMINANSPGAAGDPLSSAYPVPYFLSDQQYAVLLENTEYSRFDFRQSRRTYIHVQSAALKLQFFSCSRLLDCVGQLGEMSGRMQPLPDWVHSGAIIGLHGNSEKALSHYQTLHSQGIPISALLLQDRAANEDSNESAFLPPWSGRGEPNPEPWRQQLLAAASQDNIRLLGYVHPYVIDPGSAPDAAGFLLRRQNGELYQNPATGRAGLVDLSNPQAYNWLKAELKALITEQQWSGWVADFGEYLPVDAELYEGLAADSYHNLFPQQWARLNAELLAELDSTGQAVFLMRSGFTQSPTFTPLFWLGNQTTSWDASDGLQSVAIGLINSGLSGQTLNHADIGGTTSLRRPVPTMTGLLLPTQLSLKENSEGSALQSHFALHRHPNLLKRWIELSAFTPVFRSGEGLTPELNAQVYDADVLPHFSRFARLFAALAPYRRELMEDARERGWPLIRHPLLHFPDNRHFRNMAADQVQFMLGDSVMVAPMLTPRNEKTSRVVHLPAGEWLELWSQDLLSVPAEGIRLKVSPKMGEPPVYLLDTANTRNLILPALRSAGVIADPADNAE